MCCLEDFSPVEIASGHFLIWFFDDVGHRCCHVLQIRSQKSFDHLDPFPVFRRQLGDIFLAFRKKFRKFIGDELDFLDKFIVGHVYRVGFRQESHGLDNPKNGFMNGVTAPIEFHIFWERRWFLGSVGSPRRGRLFIQRMVRTIRELKERLFL